MSELRRHIMMQQGIDIPYIKDGLVFWLDGIDFGGDETKWIDLIQGIVCSIYSGTPIKTAKGWYFDNSAFRSTHVSFNGTMELCANIQKTNSIILYYQPNILAEWNNKISYVCQGNSRTPAYRGSFINYKTISIDGSSCIADMNIIPNNGTELWGEYEGNSIGGRVGTFPTSDPYYTKGEIFSIRFYNRILSIEEKLFNQQVDNERFNLGL